MTDLGEVLSAVVLGPDDRLVLVFPGSMPMEPGKIQEVIDHVGLRDRVLFVLDDAQAYVFRATKAEGSTVGQCMNGLWLSTETQILCHLAAGHTGAHSDGMATWRGPQE